MDLAHRCLKPADQDLRRTRLDQHFLHHNLSNLGMEDTPPISSNKVKDFTVAKVAAMLA